jgi:hypothetical protein
MKARQITRLPGILLAIGVGATLAVSGGAEAPAQDRCKMSWVVPAATATYTAQHTIEVGDVPGHQVRILELRRTFPDGARPNCEGLRLVEQWLRGYSDYVDLNGPGWGYAEIRLENGDRIFARWTGTSRTVVAPDGSRQSTFTGVTTWTGGTGKYRNVRGIEWDSTVYDPEKNLNETRAEAEYWFVN